MNRESLDFDIFDPSNCETHVEAAAIGVFWGLVFGAALPVVFFLLVGIDWLVRAAS